MQILYSNVSAMKSVKKRDKERRYDTLPNDIQHKDTQHKGLICDTHKN